MYGFFKIASIAPKLTLANPMHNAKEIVALIKQANKEEATIALFPELSLIGYSVGDLFFQSHLYDEQLKALDLILQESKKLDLIIALGIALKHANKLYNCAIVLQRGKILGIVPKSYIPNKQEFYELRHFVSGKEIQNETLSLLNQEVPFGIDLLFQKDLLCFGVEICEDLWAITPPSNALAEAGANLILNLSASNEIIGKGEYRSELVRTQSARLICAYAYASSSVGESGSDTIFSGDLIIGEYGQIVARDEKLSFESKIIYGEVDLERLSNLRLNDSSFNQTPKHKIRIVPLSNTNAITSINRFIDPHPFIPKDESKRAKRCEEISNIQAYALIRRMKQAHIKRAVIGISGGLDSTLALLSTYKAFRIANWDYKDIIAITMPGFGTTNRTYQNALALCKKLGVTLREVSIKDLSLSMFEAINHDPNIHDVTYENVQARNRTAILMNMANKENGLVIGTGDLSEIALGWSTYNGDHMSMYGLNSGIPKTLVRYIIEYFAKTSSEISQILNDILNTPVSPELLPNKDDTITQVTEDIIGPYELHDFFLYHFVRHGFSPKKILFLAQKAFQTYDEATIKKWLKVFIKRFFTQQFKRNCMPDGVMVGTISLSPRANWRMPSDANFQSFLKELE